jgi:diaminopimelate epimerase
MNYGLYHGCHNSFVIGEEFQDADYSQEAIKLCKEFNTDGYIILKHKPLEMIYHNRDGSRAPMCGNGIRCFAKYANERGYLDSKSFTVITLGGNISLEITNENPFKVKVNLGKPNFKTSILGITSNKDKFINEKIIVLGRKFTVHAVFMSTHHLIIPVDSFRGIEEYAEAFRSHEIFRDGINVNFVILNNKNHISIRTFERGAGWTLACGTGAASSFVILKLLGFIKDFVDVESIGGVLRISNVNGDIIMEGPAETIKERIDDGPRTTA